MPWANNPNVTAILAAHYPGEESGNSIVDILWGDVNPSGRLPYTIPKSEADYDIPIVNLTNVTDPNAWQSLFTEGLLIDYRHFDAKNITPLYEFGFGLSYSTFDITSPLSVLSLIQSPSEFPNPSLANAPGGNPDLYTALLNISTKVTNTGHDDGATVVQLYVSLPQDSVPAGTATQVLPGLQKIYLKAGEAQSVGVEIMRRDISYWDVVAQKWRLPKGQITFSVGFSSRDLKKTTAASVL